MNFPELIELLQVTLSRPLEPLGDDAVLAHFHQHRPSPAKDITPKKSSVLLFFYPKNNIPHFLLIKRSTYKGAHSGQVAFPGGKQEPEDVDAIHTAVREAYEEVAINSPQIIGTLSDIYVPVSQFSVTPVIGYRETRPEFILEEREVDSIIEIPVRDLLADNFYEYGSLKINEQMKIKTYFFQAEGYIVWGATAMIIAELRNILLQSMA